MRTVIPAISLALLMTTSAWAVPSGFELNLSELRGSTRPSATRTRPTAAVPGDAAVVAKDQSVYTVQEGDHFFLILMRHYGLSNDAAERLIPQIMKINGIRFPYGLQPGQRLTIPLPRPDSEPRPQQIAEAEPPATQPPAASVTSAVPPDQPSSASEGSARGEASSSSPAPPTATAITVTAGPSCQMARELGEKLGLKVTSSGILQGVPHFTACHAGLTVTVACGLDLAERYTYEKLLAQHDHQLLVLGEDEPYRRVIEKVANRLSLLYQSDDKDWKELPQQFQFTSVGSDQHTVRVTVVAGTGR